MNNLFGESPAEQEQDIQWSNYIRMVQLFFNQEQFNRFEECMNKLAPRYGTKNFTDTVLEAVQRETKR